MHPWSHHAQTHVTKLTGCISAVPSMPFPQQQWALWTPSDHRDTTVPLDDLEEATYFDCPPGFLSLLLHRRKHECIPPPRPQTYSAEHLRWLLQISLLFLPDESNSILSFLGTIESAEELTVCQCKIQESTQHCSRTNWLRYSFPHIHDDIYFASPSYLASSKASGPKPHQDPDGFKTGLNQPKLDLTVSIWT